MVPAVIDVEASGFGKGSYPIEIGVVTERGETHCFLIKPEPEWLHWDIGAESIHGITRDVLLKHGIPAFQVASKLNEILRSQTIYSDAWGNDQVWLSLLFHYAGLPQRFKVDTLRKLMTEQQADSWHFAKDEVMEAMNLKRHRASSDAHILQQTFIETSITPDAVLVKAVNHA